jgi:hypothetical protein
MNSDRLYTMESLSPAEKLIAADENALFTCSVVTTEPSCRERLQEMFPDFDPDQINAVINYPRLYTFSTGSLEPVDRYLAARAEKREQALLLGAQTIFEFQKKKQDIESLPPFLTQKGEPTAAVMIHLSYKKDMIRKNRIYVRGERFDGPTVEQQVLRGDRVGNKHITYNPVIMLENVRKIFNERKKWLRECTVYYTSARWSSPSWERRPLVYNSREGILWDNIPKLIEKLSA